MTWFKLGHEFLLDSMSDYASTAMGNYLSPILATICDKRMGDPAPGMIGTTKISKLLCTGDFLGVLLNAIEVADVLRRQDGKKLLRPYSMLTDFFVAGKEVLLKEPKILGFLKEERVPDFPRAVLLTEAKGWRSNWMRNLMADPPEKVFGKKGLCLECGLGLKNLRGTGGVAFVNPKSKETVYTQVCCRKCMEKKENNGMMYAKWEVFNPEPE